MPKRSRSGVVSRPGARGRADERERRQVERHDARAGALADGDRQPPVLHRRIEGLLQRAREAVDLVDEEDARGSSAVRNAAMSPLRSSAGPAVCTNGTSSSAATICASEVLPRPGGPASSTWSSASPRARGGLERRPRAGSRSRSWPTKSSRRRGRSERSSSSSRDEDASGVWMRGALAHRARAPRSACGDQLLGAVALGAVEQLVGLGRRVAELEQAVARQRARVVGVGATRRSRAPIASASGSARADDLLAQLDDDPLGRALADARARPGSARRRRRRSRRPARAARRPRARRAPPSARRPARR